MNLLHIISNVRKVATKNFDELKESRYTDGTGNKGILFITKTLKSREINGGLADRDKDLEIGLDEKGWVKYIVTLEYGQTANYNQIHRETSCIETILKDKVEIIR